MSEWHQIRVRLPDDVWQKLNLDDVTSRNDAIVTALREHLTGQHSLSAIAREHAMVRGFAICFATAETITGKRAQTDPATLKLAVQLVAALAKKMDEELKPQGRKPCGASSARRAVDMLLSIAHMTGDQQAAFRAAWMVKA